MPISDAVCCDNMEYMNRFPDGWFDLAVVDPPYGCLVKPETNGNIFNAMGVKSQKWDIAPNHEYFDVLFGKSKKQIILGGQYFDINKPNALIIWDKENFHPNLSDAEVAYVYNKIKSGSRIFRYGRMRFIHEEKMNGKIHPTQKPIALYKWIYSRYAKPGMKVLDTHLGSGSNRIAAWDMGMDFYSCELDQDYFNAQEKRFEEHIRQAQLFTVNELSGLPVDSKSQGELF